VLRSRFELFTAASLALHAGAFVLVQRARHTLPAETYAGASSTGSGPAGAAGDTFEIPDLEEEAPVQAAAEPTPPADDDPRAAPEVTPSASGAEAERTEARAHRPHGAGHATPAAAPSPPPLYGAVGDRSAGDLVATFKRLFEAESSDPAWDSVPIGFAADGEVIFVLAPDGTLTQAQARSAAPLFRRVIDRIALLLRHRTFTARGATTRLRMVVRVTDKLENHGAFMIDANGSFERGGRHVAVQIVER
jgi:hypothetical protein